MTRDAHDKPLTLLLCLLAAAAIACQSQLSEPGAASRDGSHPPVGSALESLPPVKPTAVQIPPPSDFPLYPTAKNVQSTHVQEVVSVTLICPGATREAVREFYRQQMPRHGWADTDEGNRSGSFSHIQYEKEDRLVTLTMAGVAEGVYVIGNIIPRRRNH